MDRMIYLAMTGAKMLSQRQETVAHNLANVSTNGYRAETTAFRAVPLVGAGSPSRVASVETTTGADFSVGPITRTGNPLDTAINGRGFFVVQSPDGSEAYTRDGSFELSPDGALVTKSGLTVLGSGGPITLPPGNEIMVGRDGTISAVPKGQSRANAIQVGRMRIVNPDEAELERGGDSFFRMKTGEPAADDINPNISVGAVEGSNVNAVEAMVSMIAIARQFETQMRLLQNAESNAREASQLLQVNG